MIITTDVVDNARDADWPSKAQQVGQEAVNDTEKQGASKRLPQSIPNGPWALCGNHASLLHHTRTHKTKFMKPILDF